MANPEFELRPLESSLACTIILCLLPACLPSVFLFLPAFPLLVIYFFVALGFELGVLCLLGRLSTT
jgi:hypothetical protein